MFHETDVGHRGFKGEGDGLGPRTYVMWSAYGMTLCELLTIFLAAAREKVLVQHEILLQVTRLWYSSFK